MLTLATSLWCHRKLICLLPFGPPGLLAANTGSYICNHSTLYTKISKEAPLLLLPTDIKLILQCSWPALLSKKTEQFRFRCFFLSFWGFLAFYNKKGIKLYFCVVILFDKKSLSQLEIDIRDIYCWWCFISCANKNLLQHELCFTKRFFECLFLFF